MEHKVRKDRIDRGPFRVCSHALTGRTDMPKICILDYECYHCLFDQMLDDLDAVSDTGIRRELAA